MSFYSIFSLHEIFIFSFSFFSIAFQIECAFASSFASDKPDAKPFYSFYEKERETILHGEGAHKEEGHILLSSLGFAWGQVFDLCVRISYEKTPSKIDEGIIKEVRISIIVFFK